MQRQKERLCLSFLAFHRAALVVAFVLLCIVTPPTAAFWPNVLMRFLPRAVVVEEAAVVRGVVASAGNRAAIQNSGRSSETTRSTQRYRADSSWIEREAGKQIIKKTLNSMDSSVRPIDAVIHPDECLLVQFDGSKNLLINRCDFAIEIGQGWMAVNNVAELIARLSKILVQAGVTPVNSYGNRIDDVASYNCYIGCVYAPGESKPLAPALLSGPLIAHPPSGTVVIDISNHYPPIELIGPIVAFQYRRL